MDANSSEVGMWGMGRERGESGITARSFLAKVALMKIRKTGKGWGEI